MVEHDLAKVGVEGSNPFARSKFHDGSVKEGNSAFNRRRQRAGLNWAVFQNPARQPRNPRTKHRALSGEIADQSHAEHKTAERGDDRSRDIEGGWPIVVALPKQNRVQ